MAIALAAAASHLFTLAASLAEDLYRVLDRGQALPRLIAAWAAIAACALAAAVFLMIAEVDPLKAALTAFAFAAATFFPTLLLAIWWRRCTKWGAFAAMTTGFAVMLGELVFGGMLGIGNAGFTTSLASLIGALLGLVAGIAVSLYLRKPSQGRRRLLRGDARSRAARRSTIARRRARRRKPLLELRQRPKPRTSR